MYITRPHWLAAGAPNGTLNVICITGLPVWPVYVPLFSVTHDCVGAITLPTSVRRVLMSIWFVVPGFVEPEFMKPIRQDDSVAEILLHRSHARS